MSLLAETGILGLISWLICFVGVLFIHARQRLHIVLPLCAGVLMLNLADYSFYSAGVYYVYWLSLGLLLPVMHQVQESKPLQVGETYIPFADQPVPADT